MASTNLGGFNLACRQQQNAVGFSHCAAELADRILLPKSGVEAPDDYGNFVRMDRNKSSGHDKGVKCVSLNIRSPQSKAILCNYLIIERNVYLLLQIEPRLHRDEYLQS